MVPARAQGKASATAKAAAQPLLLATAVICSPVPQLLQAQGMLKDCHWEVRRGLQKIPQATALPEVQVLKKMPAQELVQEPRVMLVREMRVLLGL